MLLLDALDEDLKAIAGHRKRLTELIALSRKFRAVVITCRSQFFPKDEEILTDTGVMAPLDVAGKIRYSLQKLYLSPFTDEQVETYIRRRFRWGRPRTEARAVVARIPDLVARPLLLTYVEDLTAQKGIVFAFQMYEEVLRKWCGREKAFVDPDKLREFSDRLAVELFLGRRERIPGADLTPLAAKFGVDLENWKLTGRSLLNRDAAGNCKFSHRSFLEYLFVKRFVLGLTPPHSEPWTELMSSFLLEMMRSPEAGGLAPVWNEIPLRIGARIHAKDGLPYVWIPPVKEGEKGYWMGQTPVTVAGFRRFAQETKHNVPAGQKGDDHPIVNVTWHDALAYCQWAGGRRPNGNEWEHAAMAGGAADPYGPLDEVAWYRGNSNGSTHPVGQKKPNAWGLFDMLGNVWEWCDDWYDAERKYRVVRGGSWSTEQEVVRASVRYRDRPAVGYDNGGVRCVRNFP